MNAGHDNPELHLRSINHRLADLLNTEPFELAQGGARAIADSLWVWGVIGGKDVGKTTLINALAGSEVIPRGVEVGEGTYRPAAYLAPDDADAARVRFSESGSLTIDYRPEASDGLRGVVLVDLPDVDSLFETHVEQVRRIATVLDGIIWVSTPKKLGDLRAMKEVQRVLKASSNFVHVVNKIDWLLAQADGPPLAELDRLRAALLRQVLELDETAEQPEAYLISARYLDTSAVLQAVLVERGQVASDAPGGVEGELTQAADRVAKNFQALKQALTTAPTAQARQANKRANLAYQVRRQAQDLVQHYDPLPVVERLREVADPDTIRGCLAQGLHAQYWASVFRRINAAKPLASEWAVELFKVRVARWPLLGLIAWPIALLGAALGGLRSLLPGAGSTSAGDPFRVDGLPLEDRAGAVLDRLQATLAPVTRRVTIELPTAAVLAAQLRAEAAILAHELCSAVIGPLLRRHAGFAGRVLRWLVPLAVLLWFPFVQPVLSVVLDLLPGGPPRGVGLARVLTEALSAHNVLLGLAVSLIILALMVAAVYSRAAAHARAAVARVENAGAADATTVLTDSLVDALRRPIDRVCARLAEATSSLQKLAQPIGPS